MAFFKDKYYIDLNLIFFHLKKLFSRTDNVMELVEFAWDDVICLDA